jgi:hypothetical protein
MQGSLPDTENKKEIQKYKDKDDKVKKLKILNQSYVEDYVGDIRG